MISIRPAVCIFLFCLSITVCSCHGQRENTSHVATDSLEAEALKEWNRTIPGNFSEQQAMSFDSLALNHFFESYPDLNQYREDVEQFYRDRAFRYAWFDSKGLIEQAGNLTDRMLNLDAEGIQTKLPYSNALDSLANAYAQHKEQNTALLPLEIMLSAQYFVFANIAWQGMDESISKKNDWFVPRKKVSYRLYLDSMLQAPSDEGGAAVEPVYRQYEKLRSYLRKFRALDAQNSWRIITADQKSYKLDDSSSVIALIRKRLTVLEDFNGDTTSHVYDNALQSGVMAFQSRHGLAQDGVIGIGTLAAMNVSPKSRIRQILVNMERSRWMPVRLNNDYLAVNIPEFKLHVYHDDSLLWSCNVVVGKAVHKTVIFHGDIKYVVFSPYWNVPPSIVRNEIVPGIRRDPNYIAKHNMEITGTQGGLPSVRQKPGPRNSLGLVKFLFPNSYNIYLHDSPAKSLYNETSRAFSHGCIRVSEPERLANFLLKTDTTWTKESIRKAMHAGNEKYVTMKQTVPVFIAYFTAFIDRNEKLNFRQDIYDRDERLAQMLLNEQ